MIQLGFFLWALFLILLAFSIMPDAVAVAVVVSSFFGFLDGLSRIRKEKKKDKEKRPDFRLDPQDRNF